MSLDSRWPVVLIALGLPCLFAVPASGAEPKALPFRFELPFQKPTPEDDRALDAIEISPEQEREFGAPIVRAYLSDLKRRKLKVLDRGADVDYLRKLVDQIRPFMKNAERYPTIRVLVIDSPKLEARSFSGGTLIFSRGMLEFAGSEAALVAIVGHELSHLDHGHQLAPLKKIHLSQKTLADPRQGFSPERFFNSGMSLMRLWSQPFRPQDEAAADRDGVDWAWRAGYDPRELAAFFSRWEKSEGNKKTPALSFFQTHPYHHERREAVLDRHAELQAADPRPDLYVGRENLRRRIPRAEQEFQE